MVRRKSPAHTAAVPIFNGVLAAFGSPSQKTAAWKIWPVILTIPAALAGLEEDPQALGRMMRKMSREMGEELGPEFDEVVDRLEKGQSPEDIEAALPDLGGDDLRMGGLDDFNQFVLKKIGHTPVQKPKI